MVSKQTYEHEQSLFAALADPMRRGLLVNLAEHSPRTATQLAQEYPITRQGILKHLTILEDAGLVAVHQAGREKRYTLTPEPLEELEQWIEESVLNGTHACYASRHGSNMSRPISSAALIIVKSVQVNIEVHLYTARFIGWLFSSSISRNLAMITCLFYVY